MSYVTDAEIHFAIPFDQTLFAEAELLGAVRTIGQLSHGARLEFPRNTTPGSRALLPPISAPDGITGCLPEGIWGIRADSHPEISIEAVLIVVPVTMTIDTDLAGSQVGGEGLQATLEAVSDWFDSFSHWLWVLAAQSLDSVNPDPKVVHRRSRNVVITASAVGKSSLPTSGFPVIDITLSPDGPASERLINAAVLDAAVQAAGNSPPMALELLASARMAARRSDHRRTLVDAGTAAEAALSRALGLDVTHHFTLGGLITEAQKRGLSIPTDTRVSLVEPRNDAVHRGRLAPGTKIDRALEVAEDLVALGEPSLIRIASLTAVHRPQRHDLMIIRGPSSDAS